MKVVPGQIAQAKSSDCLRVPARHRERSGEAGGSAVKIFTYLSDAMGIIDSFH
jgi:hypothetical protein